MFYQFNWQNNLLRSIHQTDDFLRQIKQDIFSWSWKEIADVSRSAKIPFLISKLKLREKLHDVNKMMAFNQW